MLDFQTRKKKQDRNIMGLLLTRPAHLFEDGHFCDPRERLRWARPRRYRAGLNDGFRDRSIGGRPTGMGRLGNGSFPGYLQ